MIYYANLLKARDLLDSLVLVVGRHHLVVTEHHADTGRAPGHRPQLAAVTSQLGQGNLASYHAALMRRERSVKPFLIVVFHCQFEKSARSHDHNGL